MRRATRAAVWWICAAACTPPETPEQVDTDVVRVEDTGEVATGPAQVPEQPPTAMCEIPGRSGAHDLAMFRELTAQRWGDPVKPAPDPYFRHGYALDLLPDGTYRWTSHGALGNRDEAGVWDFRASSPSTGLLLLDGGSAIPFAIEDDGLCLMADSPYALPPDEPHTGLEGRRRDLPDLGPPASWCLVTAEPYAPRTPWLDRPDQVTVDALGAASIQVEGQTVDGTVSMYTTGAGGHQLAQGWQVGPLRCLHLHEAEPEVHTYDSTPEGSGEWLFNHRFDPARSNPVQDLPDVRHNGVEVRGRLLGKLFRGGSLKVGAAVTTTDTEQDVEGVYVTAQALKGAALAPVGPLFTVWRQDLGSYHLNPYTWLGFRTALRLPHSDGIEFTLVVDGEPWWQESVRLADP